MKTFFKPFLHRKNENVKILFLYENNFWNRHCIRKVKSFTLFFGTFDIVIFMEKWKSFRFYVKTNDFRLNLEIKNMWCYKVADKNLTILCHSNSSFMSNRAHWKYECFLSNFRFEFWNYKIQTTLIDKEYHTNCCQVSMLKSKERKKIFASSEVWTHDPWFTRPLS